MTLERFIGYTGFLFIVIHVIPFSHTFVNYVTIILSLGLILSAMYLRWKNKIQRYVSSEQGLVSIPHLFERLETDKTPEKFKKLILTSAQYAETPFAHDEDAKTYVYEVTVGEKKLCYFGCNHSNDSKDPLFSEIKNTKYAVPFWYSVFCYVWYDADSKEVV